MFILQLLPSYLNVSSSLIQQLNHSSINVLTPGTLGPYANLVLLPSGTQILQGVHKHMVASAQNMPAM
jgi:hypothetical protein